MKAILEVEFKQSDMIDRKSLKEEFDNDMLKFMKWLFKDDSVGIFNKEIKLIDIKK